LLKNGGEVTKEIRTRVETKTIFLFSRKTKIKRKLARFRQNFRFRKNVRKTKISQKFSFKGKVCLRKITTEILHFNVNFSACLWLLSHLF
jgi:hypothetical protein